MFKILPKLTFLLIGAIGLNLSFTPKALSAVFFWQDGTPQEITDWTGRGSSVQIDIGSGLVDSGEISFDLDTSKNNTILFDFEGDSITLDINLLINAEILDTLGEPPAEMNLVETATLPPFSLINSNKQPTITRLEYISEGTITQPLSTPQETFVVGNGTIGIPQEPYLIIDIDESEFPLLFSGGGIIESEILGNFVYFNQSPKRPLAAPEPSSILSLFGLGLWGIAFGWKQQKLQKN